RHAVSLGDFFPHRRRQGGGREIKKSGRQIGRVSQPDRDRDHTGRHILQGRGLSPKLLQPELQRAVLPCRHLAQAPQARPQVQEI
ncbi:uncharacterized protein METZ01_LOCUS379907, partial [marine metagenome]